MSGDIQKSLEIYQKQLKDGYIREAYITLTKIFILFRKLL